MKETIDYVKAVVLEGGSKLRQALSEQVKCCQKNNDPSDLLTIYDKEIQDYLIGAINSKFPDHKFIAEEKDNCDDLTGYVWIIDPIDGTTNFVCLKRDFAISIALYLDGNPVYGLVYDVMNGELYMGITGEGAYLNDKRLAKLLPCNLEQSVMDVSLNSVESFYSQHHVSLLDLSKLIRGHRSYGAASLAICKIASGELQLYISAKLKSWDFAAAGIILTEVGGYYHNPLEDKLDLTGNSTTFMAASSKELFSIVKSLMWKKSQLTQSYA